MAKERGGKKGRRRQSRVVLDEDRVTQREIEWQRKHISEQKMPSWKTLYIPSEGKYIGHVNASGQRHGDGILLGEQGVCYEGKWENGSICGFGIKTFPSGDRYEGKMKEGQRHGWGYYLWNCGDKYTGMWKRNLMNGQGCFVWACGDIYTGQWKNGVMSGKGHKVYADGSSESGMFQNGFVEGWCTKTFQDGDTYTGYIVNSLRQGFGQYKWACGDVYTGVWSDDRIEGCGELVVGSRKGCIKTDKVMEYRGEFKSSSRHGFGEGLFYSGSRYIGRWDHDLPHGWGTMIYPNGDIMEGNYCMGELCDKGVIVYSSFDNSHNSNQEIDGDSSSAAFLSTCVASISPLPLLQELPHFRNTSMPGYERNQLRESLFEIDEENTPNISPTWGLLPSQSFLRDETYRGSWAKYYPHGKGTMDYLSGNIFHGSFVNGVRDGPGVLFRKKYKSAREVLIESTEDDLDDQVVDMNDKESTEFCLTHLMEFGLQGRMLHGDEQCMQLQQTNRAPSEMNESFLFCVEQLLRWNPPVENVSPPHIVSEFEVIKGVWRGDKLLKR